MRKNSIQKQKKLHKTDIDSYSSNESSLETSVKNSKPRNNSNVTPNTNIIGASKARNVKTKPIDNIEDESDTSTHSETDELNGILI
jgi:hypothetical protein